jgi:hypothetical protein
MDDDDVLAARWMGAFTPPERCVDKPGAPTEASDIWALAACMYFAVTKKAPRGEAATLSALATAPIVPVKSLAPKLGEHFAKIIDYALGREPEARYESAYAMLGDVRRVLAGRPPKLGEASRPVPSGSFAAHVAGPPSSVRGPVLSSSSQRETSVVAAALRLEAQRRQLRGNLALILAIALLVGVATFVMVREKIEEQRLEERPKVHPKSSE